MDNLHWATFVKLFFPNKKEVNVALNGYKEWSLNFEFYYTNYTTSCTYKCLAKQMLSSYFYDRLISYMYEYIAEHHINKCVVRLLWSQCSICVLLIFNNFNRKKLIHKILHVYILKTISMVKLIFPDSGRPSGFRVWFFFFFTQCDKLPIIVLDTIMII